MNASRHVSPVGWGFAMVFVLAACTSPGAPSGAPSGASQPGRQSAAVTTWGPVEPAEVHGSPATTAVAELEPAWMPSPAQWECARWCLRWRTILHDLDRHRQRAYAQGRPHILRRVYVRGAQVLVHDERMLTAWTRRAATVSGVRLRVLTVRRLASVGDGVRLRVVDRMAPATAHLPGGQQVALPRDLPTERVLVLTRSRAGWRIASST